MSQIDIAPTLLGLLDFTYYTKFLGNDMLHSPPGSERAFVANYQTLGYLKGDRCSCCSPSARWKSSAWRASASSRRGASTRCWRARASPSIRSPRTCSQRPVRRRGADRARGAQGVERAAPRSVACGELH